MRKYDYPDNDNNFVVLFFLLPKMTLLSISTNIFICLGAILMAVNIRHYQGMMKILKATSALEYEKVKPILKLHRAFIVLFLVGYLIVFYAINTNEITPANLLVSIIFFTGAIFVFSSITLKKKMITSIEKGYQDTITVNRQLSLNQQELTQSNKSLQTAIKKHQDAEITLQRSYDTQTIVNKLLKESLTDASVMDILNLCLELVLSLPWLSFESQGCIFLVEENPDELVLKAQKSLDKTFISQCSKIPFGKCLCGRAASTGKTVFAGHIDDRHDIVTPDMADHGHYCLPIKAKGTVLGLINVYLKPGYERSEWEESFLKTVANTLAIILIQHQSEEQNKSMEQRLSRSQKMESIGTLASGIAHDFNNILSGIFGHAQLAEMNLGDERKVAVSLLQINKGAQRASDLIQQILTFSRQTQYKKSYIKLHLVVQEALKFIRSSIPSTIEIQETILSRGHVKADATQIHQIIINLCTNASHAMKDTGGILSVSLKEIAVKTPHQVPKLEMIPGDYLKLEISDTGHGMPSEILNKVFEPYFTTKRISEGTGLGLAVVLGIVEEHNGYITAESTLGQGSVFRVFLPLLAENRISASTETRPLEIKGGSEHIVLVDDEDSILSSTKEMLEDFGYTVSGFLDPLAAFETFKDNPDQFDLLITDMTMPGMTGDQLAIESLKINPALPIVLCTGYSDRISKTKALEIGIKKYLQKPVDGKKLLVMLRTLLDTVSSKAD